MQIHLAGHHVDLTPALHAYVAQKLERLERHFDNVVDAHVVLTLEKQTAKAEGTVHVAGGTLHAESSHADLYAAIDLLADKLDRQVKRHKEKLTAHHQRGASKGS